MGSLRIFFQALLTGLVVANQSIRRQNDEAADATIAERHAIPKRFIVEFASNDNARVGALQSRPGLKVIKTFEDNDIFLGATVETLSDNVDTLAAMPGIARTWPVKTVKLEPVIQQTVFGGGLTQSPNYTIHDMTGVDKLHLAGIKGKGATVAVIDTGVDFKHPDLGGGFGPGFKIAGGYDFVGDGNYPDTGEKEPDNDPTDYHGHGTHVTGIIAADSPWFKGVAPEATILAYKVFTQAGTVEDDVLIDSFLTAYKAGADIITASISGLSGWQDNPWALVADRLVDAGVVVTIATGNNGEWGPFMGASGSSGKNVLAVAALEPNRLASAAVDVTLHLDGAKNTSRIAYSPLEPYPPSIIDWPVYHVGNACIPITIPLQGVIPLVDIGWCGAFRKEQNLQAAGAEFFFLFNPKVPFDGVYLNDFVMNRAYLQDNQGQEMAEALANGVNVTVSVPDLAVVSKPNGNRGGTPGYFSTWGSTYDLALKPDVGAPGAYIFSTYLDNAYATISGTSQATPYIAGIAALYIGKFGGRAQHGVGIAKKIQARIMASGETVPWSNRVGPIDGVWATPTQVGTGLVNATKVLNSDTELSFTKFSLNDTHHLSRYQGFDITNNGKETVTYTFDVQAAGGYEALWPEKNPDAYQSPRMRQWAEVVGSPLKFVPSVKLPSGTTRVQPGETKKVEFIFTPPEGMNETNMPVYSGKVIVRGSNGDQLSVPYFGVGGNINRELRDTLWLTSSNYPSLTSTSKNTKLDTKAWFTFNLSLTTQDFPKLKLATTYGTREIRWDIFDASWKERDWDYPPVVGKAGYVGSVASYAPKEGQSVFNPSSENETAVVAFPDTNIARNVLYQHWWLGRLANGSSIAPGKYNMRIAALAPFGDPTHGDNWAVWKTPGIEVVTEPKSS